MKNISEILKQFTRQQRLVVLIIILFFSSFTFLVSTYFKSSQNSCGELIELNKKYVNDFITISNMIREERINNIKQDSIAVSLVESIYTDSIPSASNEINFPPIVFEDRTPYIMDSILKLTESNLK
jgi:hypothetical protein